jgi:hypothetical protein
LIAEGAAVPRAQRVPALDAAAADLLDAYEGNPPPAGGNPVPPARAARTAAAVAAACEQLVARIEAAQGARGDG